MNRLDKALLSVFVLCGFGCLAATAVDDVPAANAFALVGWLVAAVMLCRVLGRDSWTR